MSVPEHMREQSVLAAQDALQAHLEGCTAGCETAAHQRDLCPQGARLHDVVVREAQEAYRAARPEAFTPGSHDV